LKQQEQKLKPYSGRSLIKKFIKAIQPTRRSKFYRKKNKDMKPGFRLKLNNSIKKNGTAMEVQVEG
jgi:hypothetical protein